jgi:amino acid adenylation domain-containing protein/natural product biosynthesis luciferase-like monooxygenase protein
VLEDNLVARFEAEAENAPDRVALVCGEEHVSYSRLNSRANSVAGQLRELGVGPEVRVGLCVERNAEMAVGILGTLKAGGAYVPLDPAYPERMLCFILEDARASVLVTERRVADRLPRHNVTLLWLDSTGDSEPNPVPAASAADNLAYIIYTSGSSGQPKGAMITNRNVARLLRSASQEFQFGEGDVWTLFHSYAFDFSVWEFWGALAYGARLVIVSYRVSRSPEEFADLVRREQVTVLNQTPSAFRQLNTADLWDSSLRYVIFGGEALEWDCVRPWFESLGSGCPTLVNMYGITETTVHVTRRFLSADAAPHEGRCPIGEALEDLQLYLLDKWLEPVPIGVPGELYVGGAGLARGYLNRPGLTADRFIPDSFAGTPGERLYRTGDRGVWRGSGTLEYLGRMDEQLKLRGFRVEPGEIEAALRRQQGIVDAAVLLREDTPGDKRLVAYIIVGANTASAKDIRKALAEELPEHMVPSAVISIERLPLTANGKLDRASLPRPDDSRDVEVDEDPPAGGIEELVSAVWEQVLDREHIGVDENFFDAGGHSLLATQVISRVREAFQVDLPVATLFELPTVRELSRRIDEARKTAFAARPRLVSRDRGGEIPLSFAQERLWFLEQFQPGTPAYNIPQAVRLGGNLDLGAVRFALAELARRHESLRSIFSVGSDGRPRQRIAVADSVALPVIDVGHAGETLAQRLIQAEAVRPLDIEQGPLWRTALLRLTPEDHVLLITIHHIVSDGWSFRILISEFAELYAAYCEQRQPQLPQLDIQYADFAVWQRKWLQGEVLDRQLDYWRRRLEGIPVLELPLDRPRPPVASNRGAVCRFTLSYGLVKRLKELSRQEGVTLFMTLLAALYALLARCSGQWDIAIGTDIANRGQVEIEKLIGFFINTLVLRITSDPRARFRELLASVREIALGAYDHQDVPFEKLVEELAPNRTTSHTPLFQVKMVLQNTPAQRMKAVDLTMVAWPSANGMSKLDLTVGIAEEDRGLEVSLEYATDLFDAATIERFAARYERVLTAVTDRPEDSLCELGLLPEDEREFVLRDWNATALTVPEKTAIEIFEEMAGAKPEAIALQFADRHLSYGELNAHADEVAQRLRACGVGPEVRVGLSMRRDIDLIAGLLGILKAGGAYVPLDPGYPNARLAFILEDARVPLVLTQAALRNRFASDWMQVVCIDDPPRKCAAADLKPGQNAGPHNLAYVIYTSGSTGRPKGVMVEHRGLVNLVSAQARAFGITADAHVLQFASCNFDASMFEVALALFQGASLHLISEEEAVSPLALLETIDRNGITHTVLPPAVLAALPDTTALRTVTTLIAAGETLGGKLVQTFSQGRRLVNAYGPTEATVWATVHDCDPRSSERPPIGRPILNSHVYILDSSFEAAPIGTPGELYIAGAGVARGYWSERSMTAERFVPDPFGMSGTRMYRTGDMGRWLPKGEIEFLGRNDFQIKLRGYRIEPGEIEAALLSCSGVRQAVVVALEETSGGKRLVAYLVADEPAPAVADLRADLGRHLPDYMIPAAFVFLSQMPVTVNGKLDRSGLPAPAEVNARPIAGEEPAGDVETAVVAIWREVLEVQEISRRDDFFALGGHSLLAVRVVSRLRQTLKLEVDIRDLFDYPVLRDFARHLESSSRLELPPLVRADRSSAIPLSYAQRRLWFLEEVNAGQAYHIPLGALFKGKLDRTALHGALDEIVVRHEALRTVFDYAGGQPVQRVAAAEGTSFRLIEQDLRNHPGAWQEVERCRVAEARVPFDLSIGPPIRGRLLQLADDQHVLLITMHHIVSDAVSAQILARELSILYGSFRRGSGNELPPLDWQYPDYAFWQTGLIESEVLQQDVAYWTNELAGAPPLLEIPADHVRPSEQNYAGDFVALELDADVTAALKALSRRHGVTLYTTTLAAWAALLSRLSGDADLVIGTPVANRHRQELEGLIGFFVNTLPVRIAVPDEATVSELLAAVRTRVVGAQQHQQLPFERIVEIVGPKRTLAHNPLFQVLFAWQSEGALPLQLDGIEATALRGDPAARAKFDLALSLSDMGATIAGGLTFATSLYQRPTVERYVRYYRNLVREMATGDTHSVEGLQMLCGSERVQILEDWNNTSAAFADLCIPEAFQKQVMVTPDAVALIEGDRQISYGELDRQANRVARRLIERGLKWEDRVAICAERSCELVIGLLGILKAGSAYVPVDPDYPEASLERIVRDSDPRAILAQKHFEPMCRRIAGSRPVLDLDADDRWSNQPVAESAAPGSLAYVIYTSGSTGEPKGVMVQHAAVHNRLAWMQSAYGLGAGDAVLQKTPFSFDVSVWEFFWPLIAGARLVLASPGGHKDPQYLCDTISCKGITTIHFVPSMLQVFLQEPRAAACSTLKRVFASGEVLPGPLAARLEERLPGATLHNLYGPTETTVDVTAWTCALEGSCANVPIGRPIANTRAYVLDRRMEPVPIGVVGELYIGGVQIARGYLNKPGLTAERFVCDPFDPGGHARMYRTGDLCRWRGDGAIEFVSRNDAQVKIRGFRIEPGEIEARLRECPGVREAAVIACPVAGGHELVAYFTAASTAEHAPGPEVLRSALAPSVPDHMLPTAYVQLPALPITSSGKLDRKALPPPPTAARALRTYEAPVSEIETTLAAIWHDVLGIERVGRRDNFFEVGGNSLIAIGMIERLRQMGLRLDVRAIFTASNLAELAAAVSTQPALDVPPNRVPPGSVEITPEMLALASLSREEISHIADAVPGGAGNIQEIYPLAPLQQGILFHHLLAEEKGDPYLLATEFRFNSQVGLDSYLEALQHVIDRHDILRTAIAWEGISEPVQVVWRKAVLPVEVVQLDEAAGDPGRQLYARFHPRQYRLDIRRAPLMQAYVAHDSSTGCWYLLQFLHHLAGDHTTLERMQDEVGAYLDGTADSLAPPMPFRDLLAQTRLGAPKEESEKFFRGMLEDVSEPTAPFGLMEVHGDGASLEQSRLEVEPELARRIAAAARLRGVNKASLCHLAWALVVSRLSDKDDVVFGTVVSGRMHGGVGFDRALGPFLNTLPLRIPTAGSDVATSLRRTHDLLAGLVRHEHTPLVLAQRWSAVPTGGPLFTSLFNFRHSRRMTAVASPDGETWRGIWLLRGEERTNYPIGLSVDDFGDGLVLTAQVTPPVSASRICTMMDAALAGLVDALEYDPGRPIETVEVLPAHERRQALELWNRTTSVTGGVACVHELFEICVARCPDAVAVVDQERALTYSELNRRANRLAHSLIRSGIGPDRRVGLCMSRSLDMVIGLLGVLKASAAYVPLDPTFPKERLAYLVTDSAPAALVTERALLDRLPPLAVPTLLLDHLEPPSGDHAIPNPNRRNPGLLSEHLAYVIYTSGSSGAPKGTEVTHGALTNFLSSMQRDPGFGAGDCLLALTTISFDIAALEIFLPIVSGGRLVLAGSDRTADGYRLADLLALHGITVLQATPATFRMLLEAGWKPASYIKMLCGGEALSADLAQALLAFENGPYVTDPTPPACRPLDFSLFFFAAADDETRVGAFKLLREASIFADRHDFAAVWTPERHFHPFGGIYPNPAVTGAAIAAITEKIQIRAGSVVLPLHDPLRVVEEWSTVDNWSNGRVGVSFASGWNANDFVLAPDRFSERRKDTVRDIHTIRALWRGESIERKNGIGQSVNVRVFPKPVQRELPTWLTATGNVDTFRAAGECGVGVLTHLLGQDLDVLTEKIKVYRSALRGSGNGESGRVTLMVHAFVAETNEEAERCVRIPFCRYLEHSLDLLKVLAANPAPGANLATMSIEDREALLNRAFQRYFQTRALFGDEQRCFEMLERIALAGVDEIACLIDFGVDFEAVKASLVRLARLKDRWVRETSRNSGLSISRPNVSPTRTYSPVPVLFNMYGPTETTVWSAISRVQIGSSPVGSGRPIANTRIYVLDHRQRLTPIGAIGELYIGGSGVARGYFNRPALTAERFVPDPYAPEPGARMYRTGDLARWHGDGSVEYLGRNDFQVKVRGFRIEPGEVEAALLRCHGVRQAVVVVREDTPGDKRLVAYVVPHEKAAVDPAILRSALSSVLADYMIPSAFIYLQALPLTPNGKLDRRALPAPGMDAFATRAYEEPQSQTEVAVAGIWQALLHLDRIGRHDNFFELGGNSLLAIQVTSRLRQRFELEVGVRVLFESPTVADLARHLDRQRMEIGHVLSELDATGEAETGSDGTHSIDLATAPLATGDRSR